MFTGSLIMRPVAYDAFNTGISGRTFAMPIATHLLAPSGNATGISRWRARVTRRLLRPASRGPLAADRADSRAGPASANRMTGRRRACGVVESPERAPRRAAAPLAQRGDVRATSPAAPYVASDGAGSGSSVGIRMDSARGSPSGGKAITAQASVTLAVARCPFRDSGAASTFSMSSAAVPLAASRSPFISATIVPLRPMETVAFDPTARLM